MTFSLRNKGGEKKKYEIDMVNGPLLGKIVRFAIPLALSGILQLLFNAADIVVVGRFAGSTALAAVGATGAVINLIVTMFMGLSVGANVLVAQYFGAGDKKDLSETVHTAILSSVLFGLGLIFVGVALARPMLTAMGTPQNVIDGSVIYMRIYFLGMPVMLLYNYGAAVLRAVGDTRRPMMFLLLAGVVNVALNLFFVIVLHMGVAGVAAATSISQAVSAGLVVWCLTRVDGPYRLDLKKLCIKKDKLLKMMKIGLPAGIQGASFSISNVLIQSSLNSFGSLAMAGNTAAANIEGFVSVGMDSFSQAALSFSGQNLGAGKPRRIDRVLAFCLVLGAGVGALLSALAVIFGKSLLGVYLPGQADEIAYGMRRLRICCMYQFLGGMMGVLVGVLRGMGFSLVPMVITITSVCGFRVVWLYTAFAARHTLERLYVSYPITWALAAVFDLICYFFVRRHVRKRFFRPSEAE